MTSQCFMCPRTATGRYKLPNGKGPTWLLCDSCGANGPHAFVRPLVREASRAVAVCPACGGGSREAMPVPATKDAPSRCRCTPAARAAFERNQLALPMTVAPASRPGNARTPQGRLL